MLYILISIELTLLFVLNTFISFKFIKDFYMKTRNNSPDVLFNRISRVTMVTFCIMALTFVGYVPITLWSLGFGGIELIIAFQLFWVEQIMSPLIFILLTVSRKRVACKKLGREKSTKDFNSRTFRK